MFEINIPPYENMGSIKLRYEYCELIWRWLGQSGSLSPYNDMKSLYFDDSLYENEMHYKIAKYLDENPIDDENEEIIIKCDNVDQYNATLDALFKAGQDKIKIFGTSNNPMEIVIEKDPRENYRKFDEETFLINKNTEEE